MTRTNLVLLAIALLQGIVLLTVTLASDLPELPGEGEVRPLIEVEPVAIRSLVMTGEDGQETFSFRRDGEEDAWRFEEKDGFPVRKDKIGGAADSPAETLLSKLAAIQLRVPIASQESSHEVLGVANGKSERLIVLADENGKEVERIHLARGSRTGRVYLRHSDDSEVFESDDLAFWDLGMGVVEFTGREYVKLDPKVVMGLRVLRPDAPAIEMTRELSGADRAVGPWKLPGEEPESADQEQIQDLVDRLADLRIVDVIGKATETDGKALVTFELELRSGRETLTLQARRPDGDFEAVWSTVASRPRSGFRVLIPAWALGEAPTTMREDLLREEKVEEQEDEDSRED